MNITDSSRYEGLDTCRAFSSFGVVLLHTSIAAGHPSSIDWLIMLRDCALPLMVMASFFLMTKSLVEKRNYSFQTFFNQRIKRLWIPLYAWTLVYYLMWEAILPFLFAEDVFAENPSPTLLLTGYIHLWFLQFIFVGSIIVYPLLKWLVKKEHFSKIKLFYWCMFLAGFYGIIFHLFLKTWEQIDPDASISLKTFITQTSANIIYIPLAVGFGVVSDKIKQIFTDPLVRHLSLAVVLAAMLIHIATPSISFTREIYGVAAFLAVLQPWRKTTFNFVSVLASYSYGIYIVHFFLAQLLCRIIEVKQIEMDGLTIVTASLIIYFLSFLITVLIRKTFYLQWMLPLVPISSGSNLKIKEQESYLLLKKAMTDS